MKLSDKIWITRKARINAELRFNKSDRIAKVLITYYSSFLVICSVLNLNYSSEYGSIGLVLGSILVLVTSVFLSSQKFNNRAIAMRNHYLHLQELSSRAIRFEESGNNEGLQKIESEYIYCLSNIENHSEYDFLRLRFNERNNKTTLPPFSNSLIFKYIYVVTWRTILIVLLFGLPFLSLIPCFIK